MNAMLERPEFWEIIFSIVAAIWAAVQTSNAYTQYKERIKTTNLGKAAALIESSVDDTYEDYVRYIKTESEDGKLSADERKAAKDMAVHKAIEKGKEIGIDLVQLLTQWGIEAYVQKTVEAKKVVAANTSVGKAQDLIGYAAAQNAETQGNLSKIQTLTLAKALKEEKAGTEAKS